MAAVSVALPRFELNAAGAGDRICGGSAMAVLVREHDWSRTELGPLDCWPEALVAAVNLMLESPIPSTLYWGPELAMIYNDGYRQFMGRRHPVGLGKPLSVVWPEAWPVIRQTFQGVWASGLPVQNDEFLVPIEVDGAMEDFYWSYSLSPVYDGGRILALYNTCVDVTAGGGNGAGARRASGAFAAGAFLDKRWGGDDRAGLASDLYERSGLPGHEGDPRDGG